MLWPLTLGGIALGAVVAGVSGAILGGILGHALDRHWQLRRWSDLLQRLGLRPDFEQVLFLCLGRIAKADGQVTQQHLQLARELMQQYRLDESQRLAAMRAFNQGKQQARRVERAVERLFRQQPARSAELLDGGWRMALIHGRVGRACCWMTGRNARAWARPSSSVCVSGISVVRRGLPRRRAPRAVCSKRRGCWEWSWTAAPNRSSAPTAGSSAGIIRIS